MNPSEHECADGPQSDERLGRRRSSSATASIDGLSFATDLLFNVEDVRSNCADGVAAQAALLQLVKSRVALERTYAAELGKMAQRSPLEHQDDDDGGGGGGGGGDVLDTLAALRAQYTNTSVQHRLLADNMEEEVVEPLERFHAYSAQKLQHLTKLVGATKKQVKVQCENEIETGRLLTCWIGSISGRLGCLQERVRCIRKEFPRGICVFFVSHGSWMLQHTT